MEAAASAPEGDATQKWWVKKVVSKCSSGKTQSTKSIL